MVYQNYHTRYTLSDDGCELAYKIQQLEASGELPGMQKDFGTTSRLGFTLGGIVYWVIVIVREAGEIIRLVVSVCPSVRLSPL